MPHNADETTLHRAFRTLSKSLHPDTTSLPPDLAKVRFQEICEAYELLADPQRREIYDADLEEMSFYKKQSSTENSILKTGTNLGMRNEEVRRPFSGGELFSLMLLIGVLLLSLLLGLLVFSSSEGRNPQVLPSWFPVEELISIDYVKS